MKSQGATSQNSAIGKLFLIPKVGDKLSLFITTFDNLLILPRNKFRQGSQDIR